MSQEAASQTGFSKMSFLESQGLPPVQDRSDFLFDLHCFGWSQEDSDKYFKARYEKNHGYVAQTRFSGIADPSVAVCKDAQTLLHDVSFGLSAVNSNFWRFGDCIVGALIVSFHWVGG